MSKTLKIKFTDFWGNFDPRMFYFWHTLSLSYKLEMSDNPDVLIFSNFGNDHENYKCKKIYFTGERNHVSQDHYDYGFGFVSNDKMYRLPLWVFYINWFNQPVSENHSPSFLIPPEALFQPRLSVATHFCSFVFNNPSGERLNFLEKLQQYKQVDCAGTLANNTGYVLGGTERNKLSFLRRRRFSIAFENSKTDGYVTEKLLHALIAPSVPIYWGDIEAATDFNPAAFIHAKDFCSFDDLVDYVRYVDEHQKIYDRYLAEPIFYEERFNAMFLPSTVANKLKEIIG